MSTHEDTVAGAPGTGSFDELHFHEKLARRLFNETWTLLEKTDRTPAEIDRMIHSAHASRLHWGLVGSPKHKAVGEWQIARVYSELNRYEAALYHAERSLELSKANDLPPFCVGCAHEAIARALGLRGDPAAADHLDQARRIASTLADPEEKQVLERDIEECTKAQGPEGTE